MPLTLTILPCPPERPRDLCAVGQQAVQRLGHVAPCHDGTPEPATWEVCGPCKHMRCEQEAAQKGKGRR
eukprot:1141163-Pelagomonas_calceolata.AAC.1